MHGPEEWVRIAKEDLLSAKILLKNELFSPVAYHCQQSAEKMLKSVIDFIPRVTQSSPEARNLDPDGVFNLAPQLKSTNP